MPVANSPGLTNWQLVAVCRLPIHLLLYITASNRIGISLPVVRCRFTSLRIIIIIWLPFASCLFNCYEFSCYTLKPSWVELAFGCQMPFANSPGLTNWQVAALCRLPFHLLFSITTSNRIGIWLPVASCQLPIHKNLRICIWLPFISCLFRCYALKTSNRIGILLPVAICQFTRICALASGCCLPVAYSALIVLTLSNWIGIWLSVASCQFARTDELATNCLLPVAYSPVILYTA